MRNAMVAAVGGMRERRFQQRPVMECIAQMGLYLVHQPTAFSRYFTMSSTVCTPASASLST